MYQDKNKEIVKILVANPKTNIKDKIIHTQAKSEQIKIDNYFPKRNTVHKETGNALHLATKMGNIDIVQTVLAHPDIDIDIKNILIQNQSCNSKFNCFSFYLNIQSLLEFK